MVAVCPRSALLLCIPLRNPECRYVNAKQLLEIHDRNGQEAYHPVGKLGGSLSGPASGSICYLQQQAAVVRAAVGEGLTIGEKTSKAAMLVSWTKVNQAKRSLVKQRCKNLCRMQELNNCNSSGSSSHLLSSGFAVPCVITSQITDQ